MDKITSRNLQAIKTKQRIYEAAVELFDKNGYDNTSIEDIARKIGMSVGSFYHYYPSKADIYYEYFLKVDEYYRNTVEPQLINKDFYDNVILFFKHFAIYNIEREISAVKQLFHSQNTFFTSNDRYMYRLLTKILKAGEANQQLTRGMAVDDIADFLRTFARGIIFDWLLYNGKYDLEAKMVSRISLLRQNFCR